MPKPTATPTLDLSKSTQDAAANSAPGASSARSVDSPRSPRQPPLSPSYAIEGQSLAMHLQGRADQDAPMSPRMGTYVVDLPSSPNRTSPKQIHTRDPSKSFFSNLMASKSSNRLEAQSRAGTTNAEERKQRGRENSKDRSLHTLKKQNSTPDLPRLMTTAASQKEEQEMTASAGADGLAAKQKNRSKLGGILTRSRSGRPDEDKKQKKPAIGLNLEIHAPEQDTPVAPPLRTAPLNKPQNQFLIAEERSSVRNRSADRTKREDADARQPPVNGQNQALLREGSIMSSISSTSRGMTDRLGRAGRGIFSKMTRSGSTTEREIVPDEHYTCTTINLPLVRQTRRTRIAKSLATSRDKTEFWMPALPWRCIDYLNLHCETEGLYRVPGSGRDVKFWQQRFDTEYDIDLFEEKELYDVNTIASMFKSWLRELPDELLPKPIQERVKRECMGATRTPQLLKDELSNLPPFNYYLLFAITCHLSLLHSYSDQNKMDYRNLCICFQPCLGIDSFCFQFLVVDWKECWGQGCATEKIFLEEELRYEREGSIYESGPPRTPQSTHDQRGFHQQNLSSSSRDPSVGKPSLPDERPTTSSNSSREPSVPSLSQSTYSMSAATSGPMGDFMPSGPVQPISSMYIPPRAAPPKSSGTDSVAVSSSDSATTTPTNIMASISTSVSATNGSAHASNNKSGNNGHLRKIEQPSSVTGTRQKQRSLSSDGRAAAGRSSSAGREGSTPRKTSGHGYTQTVPSVPHISTAAANAPRIVAKTPDLEIRVDKTADQMGELPELESMSPIRM